MIKPMYTLRDTLTGYNEPTCFYNEEQVKRDFTIAYKNHPNKDYMQLWYVGTFDTESGTVIANIPELIMKGVDIDG